MRAQPLIESNVRPGGRQSWRSAATAPQVDGSYWQRAWLDGPPPEVRIVPGEGATRIVATVPHEAFHCLLRDEAMPPLEAAFTLVLEDRSGALSFWSIAHPRAEPEFHDRAGFVADFTVME